MNNFLERLKEKMPEHEYRLEQFDHPIDKKNDYYQLIVDNHKIGIVYCGAEFETANIEEVTELVYISTQEIKKHFANHG
jgi:hypothetical protein